MTTAEPARVTGQVIPTVGARERILSVAYDLFSRRGIRAVGVDEIIARSGVAKATLYRHFRSKDDLVMAFLDRREAEWTVGLVERSSHDRGSTPEERLLAIFDVFDQWFRSRDEFDACSFVNVLLEMGADHPLGQASIAHLDTVREIVRSRADEAGFADPVGFARSFHILMKGSIITAAAGDVDAARRAKVMARALIESARESARRNASATSRSR